MYQHWMTARDTYITDTTQVGNLYRELLDYERTHKIRVETRTGEDVRMWYLTTTDKILLLHHYLLSRLGTKVRVQVMDKVARSYILEPVKY